MHRASEIRIYLFDELAQARAAIEALTREGVPAADLGVVTHDEAGHPVGQGMGGGRAEPVDVLQSRGYPERAASTGARAALVGGVVGLLGGLAALALPAAGTVLFLGSVAGVFTSAGAGALTAGLLGVMATHAVDEEEAAALAEAVHRGGTLLFVHGPAARRPDLDLRLGQLGAVDREARVAAWKAAGWRTYEPTPADTAPAAEAPPFPDDETWTDENTEGRDPWVSRHWHRLQAALVRRWPLLTPQDLAAIAGHRGHLVHRIRELYGLNNETAVWELDELLARELGAEAIQDSPTAHSAWTQEGVDGVEKP